MSKVPLCLIFIEDRGTSRIRNRHPVGPYSRTAPKALWWSWGDGLFLMSKENPFVVSRDIRERLLREAFFLMV